MAGTLEDTDKGYMKRYVASDGSKWDIDSSDCPPIPLRGFDVCAVHEDYDGPGDDRVVYGRTILAAIEAVETYIEENE